MRGAFKGNQKNLNELNKGASHTVHGAGRTVVGSCSGTGLFIFDLPIEDGYWKTPFCSGYPVTREIIDVISSELVADDFHCRYAAAAETYEFIMDRGVLRRHYATHLSYPLDIGANADSCKN